MEHLSIVASLIAATCGLVGAWYWYKSSSVNFWPNWEFEPVVEELNNLSRFAAIMNGVETSSRLNAIAARWTALSAVLSAASAILVIYK